MLDRHTYLIREHVGMMKLHEAFDILDPETGDLLATAVEEASSWRKAAKLVVNKGMLPFEVHIDDPQGKRLMTVSRGFTFLRSRVRVTAGGQLLGTFKQRLMSIGGKFDILDANDRKVAQLKGNLVGWNFKFVSESGQELGVVTKKWAGIGKELFTSADNYIVTIAKEVDPVGAGSLLLAAALCIDMVFKENQ